MRKNDSHRVSYREFGTFPSIIFVFLVLLVFACSKNRVDDLAKVYTLEDDTGCLVLGNPQFRLLLFSDLSGKRFVVTTDQPRPSDTVSPGSIFTRISVGTHYRLHMQPLDTLPKSKWLIHPDLSFYYMGPRDSNSNRNDSGLLVWNKGLWMVKMYSCADIKGLYIDKSRVVEDSTSGPNQ
jgi:hypothetical protein